MRERLANESRTGPWEQVMLGFLRKIDGDKSSNKNSSLNISKSQSELPTEIKLIHVRF